MRFVAISLLTTLLGVTVSAQESRPKPPAKLKLPEGVSFDQLADETEAKRVALLIEKAYPEPRSEATKMLLAILSGSQLNGNDGWFGPANNRYSFEWLATRCGVDAKAATIPKDKFTGSAELFDRLDRDGDGNITPSDLDWSDRSPYVMQAGMLNRLFRRWDTSGDGRLTQDELNKLFTNLAKGRDHFTADDFRRAMIPRGPMGFNPGDAPTIPTLVKGLFNNEVGSMDEGPKLGDIAPDFVLKTVDGKESVQLSKLVGPKPVVLVLGNFTCGPFRSLYPDVEAVFRRFQDKVTFVMVYVREAHPTDGWKMEANTRAGVSAKQPTTYDERVQVCEQFRKLIQPGVTLTVDDINDPVGNAYSGMPARLYVIDTKGKVAYKSGRGPFGFKPGEMEQALVMNLVETATKEAPKLVELEGLSMIMPLVPLWEKGAPGFENRKDEKEVRDRQNKEGEYRLTNVHNPYVTVFLPAKEKATGAAVVIVPGGGHRELWPKHEGENLAEWLREKGVASVVVRYRLAREKDSPYKIDVHAVQDGQRALRLVRSHAKEWNINPNRVGMMGFSAGGEVVALICRKAEKGIDNAADPIDRESAIPSFQALVYSGPQGIVRQTITKESGVPPTWILVGDDDGAAKWLVQHYQDLKQAGVSTELHVYAKIGHGFGMRPSKTDRPVDAWPMRFYEFLGTQGMLKNP